LRGFVRVPLGAGACLGGSLWDFRERC
jgi:hypothetical protein